MRRNVYGLHIKPLLFRCGSHLFTEAQLRNTNLGVRLLLLNFFQEDIHIWMAFTKEQAQSILPAFASVIGFTGIISCGIVHVPQRRWVTKGDGRPRTSSTSSNSSDTLSRARSKAVRTTSRGTYASARITCIYTALYFGFRDRCRLVVILPPEFSDTRIDPSEINSIEQRVVRVYDSEFKITNNSRRSTLIITVLTPTPSTSYVTTFHRDLCEASMCANIPV